MPYRWGFCDRHWREERARFGPHRVHTRGTVNERFWAKVDKGPGCWTWNAGREPKGYGQFGMDRGGTRWTTTPAHRVAWELVNGPIPEGLLVLHHCDNPPCVRPDHLYIGTHADNARDRTERGRGRQCPPELHARGERHARSKLTETTVRDIRSRYAAGGISQQALADEYGTIQSAISCVILRKTWRHVT
jgi:hypothetical protein